MPLIRNIHLLPGRDKALRQGHPWLFSGAIAREDGPDDAPLARVLDAAGARLGLGFYSRRSQIRVRLLSGMGGGANGTDGVAGAVEAVDRPFFASRLTAAMALRSAVVPPGTTGYRLFNAEGDGVPGWTLDRFGDVLVSQVTVAGLEALRAEAYGALRELFPASTIVQLNDLPARRAEGLPASRTDHDPDAEAAGMGPAGPGAALELIAGDSVPSDVPFTESGLRFTADLGGQKTGFYCDQRESRRLVERLAAGRRVLDLFAHAGAFGVYALRGGAASVTAVESAPPLATRATRLIADNGLDLERLQWTTADVFTDLRRREERYDLVVCDPPPLARRRHDQNAAARAYKDVNRLALRRCAPGAFFLTFSCSGAIDTTLFRQILFAAAVEAGVGLQLLQPLAAAPDHPVAVTHPQGEYLKGWWGRVTGTGI